jgi:hypothetical protein
MYGKKFQLGTHSVDFNLYQHIALTNILEERIANRGYARSAFSYLLLPIGVGAENGNMYKELVDFYKNELGVSLD